jgi:glutamate N-acetyltransferase / amino-acid N-acetyltransferase
MSKGIVAPKGFFTSGIWCGIKKKKKDLALIYSEYPCTIAGVTTKNQIKAAPIILAEETLKKGKGQAVIINSGNANACTGVRGMNDAKIVRRETAKLLDLKEASVVVASTGIIGKPLPVNSIKKGLDKLKKGLTNSSSNAAAEAILTTDLATKTFSIKVKGTKGQIGGIAKGSGMIHPDMATMLAFLTTDLNIEKTALKKALKEAVDDSFNMISVDGDTSTNDMVMIMSNGACGSKLIREANLEYKAFKEALTKVCVFLAQQIVKDGEGAKKIFEVQVKGAVSKPAAVKVCKTIITSPLVKTAIAGSDNNWGRVLAAVGRAGVKVDPEKIKIEMRNLKSPQPKVIVNLGSGKAAATAWGCDLNEGYIKINKKYN